MNGSGQIVSSGKPGSRMPPGNCGYPGICGMLVPSGSAKPPEISDASSSSTSSASSRSFLGTLCIVTPFMGWAAGNARPRLRGSDGLGRVGNGRGKARGLDVGGRLLRRRTVGELIKRGRKRHATGDAQYFLEAQFLHFVLPLKR